MNTPAAIPMPIASHTRIAPSMLVSASLVSREPALERREREVIDAHRPAGLAREVDGQRRTVDQGREVRADRRWQLRGVPKVCRNVGAVFGRIRVVALAQE